MSGQWDLSLMDKDFFLRSCPKNEYWAAIASDSVDDQPINQPKNEYWAAIASDSVDDQPINQPQKQDQPSNQYQNQYQTKKSKLASQDADK